MRGAADYALCSFKVSAVNGWPPPVARGRDRDLAIVQNCSYIIVEVFDGDRGYS